ncbi:MAG: hypothetical protein IKE43_03740 [Coriobacteriales bacterium]|nr:hypothetical protein [Coriobacteriales bacterium]
MDTSKEEAYHTLIQEITNLGFPQEFGMVIACELKSQKAMLRMASYLRQAKPQIPEDIADEMLAIIEERNTWIEHKISEHANSSITQYYNR